MRGQRGGKFGLRIHAGRANGVEDELVLDGVVDELTSQLRFLERRMGRHHRPLRGKLFLGDDSVGDVLLQDCAPRVV